MHIYIHRALAKIEVGNCMEKRKREGEEERGKGESKRGKRNQAKHPRTPPPLPSPPQTQKLHKRRQRRTLANNSPQETSIIQQQLLVIYEVPQRPEGADLRAERRHGAHVPPFLGAVDEVEDRGALVLTAGLAGYD